MKKPVVVLFTITNKEAMHTLGLFNLKAYVLEHLKYIPKPSILIKICKVKTTVRNKHTYFFRLTQKERMKIVTWILEKKPVVIGFSCWLSNSPEILKIARMIKQRDDKIKTVFGGTDTYHNYFYDRENAIRNEMGIDVITRYDGEEVFLDLLESYIYKKKSLSEILGIAYRDGNKIIINKERTPMVLKDIPSPYITNTLTITTGTKIALVENSRGCPYRCDYCSFPAGNFGFCRYLPPDRVKNDLLYLLNKKLKFITLLDNNFNINAQRSKEILKLIIENNVNNIHFDVFYNASNQIIDEETAALCAQSKILLKIGVQSINPIALKAVSRQTDITILERNLTLLDKKGARYALEFIYGLPGDGYVNIKNVINWIFRFKLREVAFYRLCILKGTPFSRNAKALGIKFDAKPPYYVLSTKQLTTVQLNKIDRLLDVVLLCYNDMELRKIIYQINGIFHLDFASICEQLLSWYKTPPRAADNKAKLRKYMFVVVKHYMAFLFQKRALYL
jgi:radical SAM superfamily enzyme YgiQ (UPF0313 family)